jgi:CRISPR-associated protein Csm2
MSYDNKRPPSGYSGGRNQERVEVTLSADLLAKIDLKLPSAELFDTVAEEIAKDVGSVRDGNLSTQLRRFYDEVCQWHQRVQLAPDEFQKALPLIRMINAKVVYAQGRKLVDAKFAGLMQDCLRKVVDVESFNNFKLFFEAFLGFYKIHKPK